MKKKTKQYIIPVVASVIFVAFVGWFILAVNSASGAGKSGRLESVKRSVENAVTLCYSIEGAYPESLEYLSENYGVNYDKDLYIIHYDCFAANVRPSVTVAEKGA